MSKNDSFQRLKFRAQLFIAGGEWSLSLSVRERQNLFHYWFVSLFAAASDAIPMNYCTLYLLALGATGAQVGLFSSLISLTAAICLLPGALLVERFGHRKEVTVWLGGGIARFMLLVLALLPFGQAANSEAAAPQARPQYFPGRGTAAWASQPRLSISANCNEHAWTANKTWRPEYARV